MRRHLVLAFPSRAARLLYKAVRGTRPAGRALTAGGLLLCLAALPGCGALRLDDGSDPIVTGSVKVQPVSLPVPEGSAPSGIVASDWAQAKLALEQALSSRDKAPSIPWDNPKTGARGTATPIGTTDAAGCREFRIGLVDGTGEHWVQGAACRDAKGALALSQVRVLGRA